MVKMYLLSDEATLYLSEFNKNCEILSFGTSIRNNNEKRMTAPSMEEGLKILQKRKLAGYERAICLYSSYPGVNMAYYYRMIFPSQEAIFFDTKTLFPATMIYYYYLVEALEVGYDETRIRKDLEHIRCNTQLFFSPIYSKEQKGNEKSVFFRKSWKRLFNYFPLFSFDEEGQLMFLGEQKEYEAMLQKIFDKMSSSLKCHKSCTIFVASSHRQIDLEKIKTYLPCAGNIIFCSLPTPLEHLLGKESVAIAITFWDFGKEQRKEIYG